MFLNWWHNGVKKESKPSECDPRNRNRHSSPAARARRRFVPLSLEVLESRTLLSTDTWMNPNGGNWDDGSNWDLGHAPHSDDTALLSTSAAATITIQANDNLQVQSVTTGSNATLSVAGGSLTVTAGSSTLSGPLSMTGGLLTAIGSGVKLTANGRTTLAGTSLYVQGGATLSLPQLSNTTNVSTVQADGVGSVLDLSALTTSGPQVIEATNGGTLLLTGLTSLGTGDRGSVSITDTGNSKLLDSNLTGLDGVDVTLDGTDPQVANSWTSFSEGTLNVTGGSYRLAGLNDANSLQSAVNDSNLFVSGGGHLALPSLHYINNNVLQADGPGSVLDVSAVERQLPDTALDPSSLAILVTNGGTIDLSKLGYSAIPNYSPIISEVQITDTGNSRLLDGNVLFLFQSSATLDGTDPQVANSWVELTNGSLEVTGGSYSLPNLIDVDDSNLSVSNGGHLALPGLRSYSLQQDGILRFFRADGSGSVLDVSSLTSVPQQNYFFQIYAVNGGQVITAPPGGGSLGGFPGIGGITGLGGLLFPSPTSRDITALVTTTLTAAPAYKKGKSKGFAKTLTITNRSGEPLPGPFDVVLHGLKSTVNLRNALGHVGSGKQKSPFVVVLSGSGSLQPHSSVRVLLQFSAKPNRFTLSVLTNALLQ
jgi:hypothetical protein